ncbi:TPA: hypothetical protein DEO28_02845 [Candidatus Dependentiae bacterium]|nr:hypothetical protein [Candidatus Dependentiae bacterium]HBZ73421.1 hypothetical protein [Candidatus Dependentiae bacterium]
MKQKKNLVTKFVAGLTNIYKSKIVKLSLLLSFIISTPCTCEIWYKKAGLSYFFHFPIFYFQIILLVLWFFAFFYLKHILKKKKKALFTMLFLLMTIVGIIIAVRQVKILKQQRVLEQNQILSSLINCSIK